MIPKLFGAVTSAEPCTLPSGNISHSVIVKARGSLSPLGCTTSGTWANAVPANSTEDTTAISAPRRNRFFMFSLPFFQELNRRRSCLGVMLSVLTGVGHGCHVAASYGQGGIATRPYGFFDR